MKLFNIARKFERQRNLYDILKEEILDIELKDCKEEITDFKIAELAVRLIDRGVRVESGAQDGRFVKRPYGTILGADKIIKSRDLRVTFYTSVRVEMQRIS